MNDNEMLKQRIDLWDSVVFGRKMEALHEILSPNVVLHSPFVFRPKDTFNKTKFILENVIEVLEDFKYNRKVYNGKIWALEFAAHVGDIQVKGIDLIEFDDKWQIKYFEVFMRPVKGLMAVADAMGKRIEAAGGEPKD